MNESQNDRIAALVKAMLKPLARILIKFNVSHSVFSEYSKQAFAEAAYDHFQIPGKRMTFARVAVLTGLSRKQVIRILSENENSMPQPKITENRATRVRMGWISDRLFSLANNKPKVLQLKGKGNTFEKLVEMYSGDIPANAILDEMILNGMAEVSSDGTVSLLNAGAAPPNDELKKFENLGACAADLLGTGVFNIEGKNKDRRLLREYKRSRVPKGLAEKFQEYSEEHAQEMLVEFFNWLKEENNHYVPVPGEERKQVGIGVYYFENEINNKKS